MDDGNINTNKIKSKYSQLQISKLKAISCITQMFVFIKCWDFTTRHLFGSDTILGLDL